MASTTRDLAELIYIQMAARIPPDAAKTDAKAAEAWWTDYAKGR